LSTLCGGGEIASLFGRTQAGGSESDVDGLEPANGILVENLVHGQSLNSNLNQRS